ncbi:MAG: ABC transporter permease [Rhabdochlamydiaceae bacterium]
MLIFLSISRSIEKKWIENITSLHGALNIYPSDEYYHSYFYQIDSISSDSSYKNKSIQEKLYTSFSDPYDQTIDEEIPPDWPVKELDKAGHLLDPVKTIFQILNHLKTSCRGFYFNEFKVDCGLVKLTIHHTDRAPTLLTQASYFTNLPEENSCFYDLILKPTITDINHLKSIERYLDKQRLYQGLNIEKATLLKDCLIPATNILEGQIFKVFFVELDGVVKSIFIPKDPSHTCDRFRFEGMLKKDHGKLILTHKDKSQILSTNTLIYSSSEKNLPCKGNIGMLRLQNQTIYFPIETQNYEIKDFNIKTYFVNEPVPSPYWSYYDKSLEKIVLPKWNKNTDGVLLPKSFQDNKAKIGDRAEICYSVATINGLKECKTSVFVAGFYDPGVISVGYKGIILPNELMNSIYGASPFSLIDKKESNGIRITLSDLKNLNALEKKLTNELRNKQISKYWTIKTYKDFEFAKEIINQFAGDKILFTLISIIILIVACSNILSMLVIMVNDKKKEIGTLQALGCSRKNIAIIFSCCGFVIGFIGSLTGTILAYVTLYHLPIILKYLSFLNGYDLLQTGLIHARVTLSLEALFFVSLTTPLISVLAALVPAFKAARLDITDSLRSE